MYAMEEKAALKRFLTSVVLCVEVIEAFLGARFICYKTQTKRYGEKR